MHPWGRTSRAHLLTIAAFLFVQPAEASSHREAPGVLNEPATDLTDFYVFRSPGKETHISFVLNTYPGMLPQSGPNWYLFAEDAVYEIHVDKDGDGSEDVTYQFRFKTADYKDQHGNVIAFFPDIKFENGRFTGGLSQTYTVVKITGNRRKGIKEILRRDMAVAPPRIGPYTTDGGAAGADNLAAMYNAYRDLSNKAIVTDGMYRFFAGPRNDSFFGDIGAIFDRVAVRIPGLTGTPHDSFGGLNVLSMALDVPISDLVESGNSFFGTWATVSRPQGLVRRPGGKDNKDGGPLVQVSRLGNPLLNELFVRLKDKDRFNAVEPREDSNLVQPYLLRPQLASVLNLLYSRSEGTPSVSDIAINPDLLRNRIVDTNRVDVSRLFLDGFIAANGKSINRHPKAKEFAGDMLRVNLALPEPLSHWPLSGRRVEDDVVKALLTFLAQCGVFPTITGNADSVTILPNGAGDHPRNWLGIPENGIDAIPCKLDDFVGEPSDRSLGSTRSANGLLPSEFPYLDLPHSGYVKANYSIEFKEGTP